ncbi:Translation initiation factor if-2 like [Thalictrum thalictroides]|uniref:Translation initiation factor if-2 like n=1 Tax=Thalictrum thalictroides TaxID=46969 RepID=A0A7J6X535_THATH|nr:Translation initiation factor if-2 like [Thalictrum thalictroides]
MVRNLPSFPQTNFVSADELIVDGVLLPLDLVSHHSEVVVEATQQQQAKVVLIEEADPDSVLNQLSVAEAESTELTTVSSASKRWRDIFKKGEKKSPVVVEDKEKNIKEKEKKKDRKSVSNSSNGGVSSGTELNINIWPFSRSWSAGTGGNRSKLGGGSVTRKVSSAPCSRSNSAGESKSKKWPNSPSRTGGIHLGRNSPVWHVKPRSGSGLRNTEPVVKNVEKIGVRKEGLEKAKSKSNGGGADVAANKSNGLNLNVPMCIGYRQQLSCRRDESTLIGSASGDGGDSGGGCSNNSSGFITGGCNNNSSGAIGGNTLFYLRTLFTKKVY